MKKRLLSVLLILVLLLAASAPAALADGDLATEEEVVAFLSAQKTANADQIEFTCTQDLFDKLLADDGLLLTVLEIKAGISDSRIRYYKDERCFQLTRLTYTDAPWCECKTEAEACQAVRQLLEDGADSMTLICPSAVATSLARNGALPNYASQAGYYRIKASYYTTGIIRISNPEAFEGPYAVVEDAAQFAAAVQGFAEQGRTSFNIVFAYSLYNKISDDWEQREILEFTSMLDSYHSNSANSYGALHYYDVTYTEEPGLLCHSEEELVSIISGMGAVGITDFRLYLIGEELQKSLKNDSWKRLHELEAQAGMTSSRMSYTSTCLYYTEATIVSEVVSLQTEEEALAYMAEKAAAGEKDITLFCSPELFKTLLGNLGTFSIYQDGMDPIYDLISQAGIFDYDFSISRATNSFSISIKSYYPGTEILRAVDAEKTDELPERLQETLEAAEKLAEDCAADSELETARRIHDALCEMIVYTDDEQTDEDDTAIGALLNGEANCDGYSDAFYLVGTLAGLKVRYQHGDSLVKGYGVFLAGNGVTHMWNLLEIDDTWRMVDVTWDDGENGPEYTWFNLGYDRASRTHVWNKNMTVELLEETDLSVRPENEYTVLDDAGLQEAVSSAAAVGQGTFIFIFDDENYAPYKDALELISKAFSGSYRYSWTEEMRALRVYAE